VLRYYECFCSLKRKKEENGFCRSPLPFGSKHGQACEFCKYKYRISWENGVYCRENVTGGKEYKMGRQWLKEEEYQERIKLMQQRLLESSLQRRTQGT